MGLIIIDIINSVLQSIVFAYAIIYCVDKKEKIDKIKLFVYIIDVYFISNFFTGTFGENFGMCVFSTHLLSLGVVVLFYKKNIINALIAYTIIYSIIGIYSIIFGNLIFEYVKGILPIKYINYEKIFIIYIPEWILIFICFKYIKKIKQVYKIIINEGLLIIIY